MQETIFPPQMKCARHLDACLTPRSIWRGRGDGNWKLAGKKGPNNEAHANANANAPVPGAEAGATSLQDVFLGFRQR